MKFNLPMRIHDTSGAFPGNKQPVEFKIAKTLSEKHFQNCRNLGTLRAVLRLAENEVKHLGTDRGKLEQLITEARQLAEAFES